jgi:hypothetical protein
MRDFIDGRVVGGKQQISTLITWHTFSELILWPYGYTAMDVPADMTQDDHDVFVAMGRTMAATNGYTAEQSSDLYIIDGDLLDWAYATHKIFGYTFEMYPTTGYPGFYPPGSVIDRETSRNREAVLYLSEQSDCPYRAIGKEGYYCGTPVTLTGSVVEGVENGCLLLDAGGDGSYLLVGGPREVMHPGAALVVTGHLDPDMVTTCQQGIPLVVTDAQPA